MTTGGGDVERGEFPGAGSRRTRRRFALACAAGGALLALGCGSGRATAPDAAQDTPGPEASVAVDPTGCRARGEPGATSQCLVPHLAMEFFVEQGQRYFDTLDVNADPKSVPNYSAHVARWEWPPWLKLTGFERDSMISIGGLLKQFDPSTVPTRDCRAFPVQPFARCHVVMAYDGRPCPIYEEFTFNDQGEMTFIEAWSDLPDLLPTPDAADRWAEGPAVHRLSTKIPGLGNATGTIDLEAAWMADAAARDPEIADFVTRARDFWQTWYDAFQAAGSDLFARGCGW